MSQHDPSSSQSQVTSVNTSAHTVTFSPAYSGSTLPVGTMIARRAAGSTYQYQLLSGAVVPAGWTRYTATFGTFRAGTEKIRLITLLGYAAGATTGFTGLEFWEGTQSDRPNLYYTLDGNTAVYGQTPVAGPVKITLTGNKPGTSSRVINLGQRGTCYIDATPLQRTITFKAATPTLTFEYLSGNQVKVTATCATAGAIFRYTTDGSEPVDASPSFANNVTTTASAPIKVKAFKTDYVPSDTVGRLAPPAFSPAGATFENDTTVTVSAPSGASLKILRSNRNYLDTSTWVLNSQGTQPGFNAFGSASENIIENGLNPFGTIEKVWAAYNDAASGADGGWDSVWFNVDKTKTYRFSVWIKKTGSNSGYSYLGCGGGTVSTLTGSSLESEHNNPYFYANNTIPLNEWCLIVGFIHPAGHTGATSYGKIYNAQGGVITTCTDYKWLNTTINSYHRTYLYDCTDPSVRQYFWSPKVEEVISLTDPVDVYFASSVASPQTISLTGNLGNYISAICYSSNPLIPNSGVASQNYLFRVAAPSVTMTSSGTLSATTITIGGTIRYTTNGSEPNATSTIYTVPVSVPNGSTAKFKGFRSFYDPSATTSVFMGDSDSDGLPDPWELTFFGDLVQTGFGDFDVDGVTNLQEYLNGTDPASGFALQVYTPLK